MCKIKIIIGIVLEHFEKKKKNEHNIAVESNVIKFLNPAENE